MTASIRVNTHPDLKRIDETLGNINVDGGYLLVNEGKIDRQTHTHHRSELKSEALGMGSNPSIKQNFFPITLILTFEDCLSPYFHLDF